VKAQELFEIAPTVKKYSLQLPRDIYVIAEIGINHNGDLSIAKELIDEAVAAGCDAVKFQKRNIELVYSKTELDKPRESPWGDTQRAQKEGLEFSKSDYDVIDAYCKSKEIEWTASAWDLDSLEFIEKYAPPFHKIASALTTNLEFVSAVAKLNRTTFMSTGMCTDDQIGHAVEIFKENGTKLMLMHTVSTYPSDLRDLNLLLIPELREKYGCPVGYSGHEPNVSPTLVAASLGAVAIERHITLSRAMYGSDQAASLEPAGLRSLVGSLRKIPEVRGDGVRKPIPAEAPIAKKLRYWES
jgi:N-acetylneuraminate synthase